MVGLGRLIDRPSTSVATEVLAVLAVVIVLGSAYREHGFGPGRFDMLAGMWVGLVLVALGGAVNVLRPMMFRRE
jgi:Co/Zn/Cd efflux system component